jgi:Zn finger protein HypA/HybF involved in hydrogenase expression
MVDEITKKLRNMDLPRPLYRYSCRSCHRIFFRNVFISVCPNCVSRSVSIIAEYKTFQDVINLSQSFG